VQDSPPPAPADPTGPTLGSVVEEGAAKPADPMNDEKLANSQSDRELKREYAKNLYKVMIGQVVVADCIFVGYAYFGRDWDVQPAVMQFWLGATVVQVVGIVAIITRSLFPGARD